MPDKPNEPEITPEEIEDDPQLRKLFKGYFREALDEWLSEHGEEEATNDDDGSRRGPGHSGDNVARDSRAGKPETKVQRISKSIFSK